MQNYHRTSSEIYLSIVMYFKDPVQLWYNSIDYNGATVPTCSSGECYKENNGKDGMHESHEAELGSDCHMNS